GIRDFHVTGVQTCALPICLAVGVDVDRARVLDLDVARGGQREDAEAGAEVRIDVDQAARLVGHRHVAGAGRGIDAVGVLGVHRDVAAVGHRGPVQAHGLDAHADVADVEVVGDDVDAAAVVDARAAVERGSHDAV